MCSLTADRSLVQADSFRRLTPGVGRSNLMDTAYENVRAAARRLAPVGRAWRRAGEVATGPRACKGLAIAGGVALVAAAVGVGVLAAAAGLDGDSLSGLETLSFGAG